MNLFKYPTANLVNPPPPSDNLLSQKLFSNSLNFSYDSVKTKFFILTYIFISMVNHMVEITRSPRGSGCHFGLGSKSIDYVFIIQDSPVRTDSARFTVLALKM